MSQFEKSSDQSFQFGQAELAPGAGARFGFVPGVAPQMGDLPKGPHTEGNSFRGSYHMKLRNRASENCNGFNHELPCIGWYRYGYKPRLDRQHGRYVAPALPLVHVLKRGDRDINKAPPHSHEASPCCSLTTLNLSWNSLGWDANRWLGEKGP